MSIVRIAPQVGVAGPIGPSGASGSAGPTGVTGPTGPANGLYAYKPSTTTRNATIVQAADPHLTVSITTVGTYSFVVEMVVFSGSATPGFAVSVVYSGTTSASNSSVGSLYTSNSWGESAIGTTSTLAISAGVFIPVRMFGFFTATTTGTFTVNWSQAQSHATATNLRLGAFMAVYKVA